MKPSDDISGKPDLDANETRAFAEQWAAYAKHDAEHFLAPLIEATGFSRQELLLYLINEHLAHIAEHGVTVQIEARHDIIQHPPEEPLDDGESWKRDKSS